MFWDTAEVKVAAGRGGDGLVSFLHEKYREHGGPDGGDGGHGGSIHLIAKPGETTLSYFRAHRLLTAERGENGKHRHQHGKSGQDLEVEIPAGTIIRDHDGKILADLSEGGQRFRAARGGRGGFGNAHFTSSRRQTPDVSELGEAGEGRTLSLELKLIADVGLVGAPNAGKSTLLSIITAAKPKIAAYPFTTTVPGLGVVERGGFHFVVCDIPGLIEGASEGKGLGHEFLRHVERSRLLLHLIDGSAPDPAATYRQIRAELKKHDPELMGKPELIVINKTDQPAAREVKIGKKIDYRISAATGEGVDELLRGVAERLARLPAAEPLTEPEPSIRRYSAADDPKLFLVEREGEGWRVTGGQIERFARRLDLSGEAAQRRFRDILERRGVTREIVRLGGKSGEMVLIGDQSVTFRSPHKH